MRKIPTIPIALKPIISIFLPALSGVIFIKAVIIIAKRNDSIK